MCYLHGGTDSRKGGPNISESNSPWGLIILGDLSLRDMCVSPSTGLTSTASLNRYDLSATYSATKNLSDQETTCVTVSRAEALQEEIVMYIVSSKGQLPNNYIHTHTLTHNNN